jgi:hypothetical protein
LKSCPASLTAPPTRTNGTLIARTLAVRPYRFPLSERPCILSSKSYINTTPISNQAIFQQQPWTTTQTLTSTNARCARYPRLQPPPAKTQHRPSPKPLLLTRDPLPRAPKTTQQHDYTRLSHRLRLTLQPPQHTVLTRARRPCRTISASTLSTHDIRMRRRHSARSSMRARVQTNKVK